MNLLQIHIFIFYFIILNILNDPDLNILNDPDLS